MQYIIIKTVIEKDSNDLIMQECFGVFTSKLDARIAMKTMFKEECDALREAYYIVNCTRPTDPLPTITYGEYKIMFAVLPVKS